VSSSHTATHVGGHRAATGHEGPLLEVDHVVVQFGGVTAVNEACFTADPGTVTGLIGPNGAGKTTCFNVISGLQKPTRGKVRFQGKDVSSMPVHRRSKKGMGRTFQRLEAFGSLSVRDNVRVAADIHRGVLAGFLPGGHGKDVDALLERVGIAAYADERADSIPTGTARLLELARCLAGDPKLLLLDEPSSGLDETETDAFGELLRDLAAEGRAILMVEHDMDLVMAVCDTIHVLDFGSIIASGDPAAIRRDPVVQKAYLGYSDEDGDSGPAEAHTAVDLPVVSDDTMVIPAAREVDA
jgi:branched-chain amino acid transport system ATP-binding protein